MTHEPELAAMREALLAVLQSHVKLGKAYPCTCSLCSQIRAALESNAGREFADRLREECAQVADWKADQLTHQLTQGVGPESVEAVRASQKTAREIGDRIRVLKGR